MQNVFVIRVYSIRDLCEYVLGVSRVPTELITNRKIVGFPPKWLKARPSRQRMRASEMEMLGKDRFQRIDCGHFKKQRLV